MSRKKVTVLSINSLSTLSKRISSCNSLNSINFTKTLALVKNLSTAAERSFFQHPNDAYAQNSAMSERGPTYMKNHNESQEGVYNYTGSVGDSQHVAGNYHSMNAGDSHCVPPRNHAHAEMSQQSPNGPARRSTVFERSNFQENIDSYPQKNLRSQEGPDYTYSRNYKMSPQGAGNYTGNMGNPQQVSSNHCLPGDKYTGDAEIYQRTPSGYYENVNNGNGHLGEKVERYQQSGNYHATVGQYQQILNGPRSSTSIPDGESAEAAENNQLSGTIDDFDNLCKEGKLKDAVQVLHLLEQQCVSVDTPRYVALMNLCGEAKALEEAKFLHEHLLRSVSHLEISSYNKILEMYFKCGSAEDAYLVFQSMPQRNLTSWDTMITCLAKNGLGEDAIDLFTQFKSLGLKPDNQMFFGVFSACSVLGDIDEGLLHFKSMSRNYGIDPSMEHYVSIVDMFGSAGYLDEAWEFVEKMPMDPSVEVWETLMILCRAHGNMELGDLCAEHVELLDPSRLDEQSKAGLIPVKASDLAKERERKKTTSQNFLEMRSRDHSFVQSGTQLEAQEIAKRRREEEETSPRNFAAIASVSRAVTVI
ncbi:hypothetical protein RJ639_032271 [Escallonia herrerae]|uniref:Pentatricopeptide repeat-containing protein n=1 Tax=Escallonia herrerae TaxID=1293975 RepID=A0AA88X004_9ASTE|nr:hypothetical protein RJ639_032271 [Escallonia herrerae]